MARQDIYSTHTAARICRVTPMTVIRWIESGHINAYKTAGGHRRIRREDLEDFCRRNAIPLAPIDENAKNRVLVVDDEPLMCEVLKDVVRLALPDAEVHVATNGFDAGRLVTELRPQLMFLDLMMPGIDGFEVCKRVKSEPSTAHTDIIAISALMTPENQRRIIAAGARTTLSKPLDLDAVGKLVKQAFLALDAEAERQPARGRPKRRRKVLYVGDGASVEMDLLQRLNNKKAFDTRFVSAPVQALLMVGMDRPDAIVLDTATPGLDARSICVGLKAIPEFEKIEVIGIVQSDSQRDELLEAGAKTCLRRPFTPETLIGTL